MRLGVVLSGVLVLGALFGAPSAQGAYVDPVDVQTLPRHLQEIAYPHELQGASPGYVLHDVHDLPRYDGHNHLTVLRTSDGSAAWSDFDVSPDAEDVSLVGRYLVEKVGGSTYWPDSLRYFDVETHTLAGTIVLPDQETLAAVGPGWILSTHPGGSDAFLGSFLVVHRLDGSSDELTDVPMDTIPTYAGTDGNTAWVRDNYSGPLFQVDVATGDATVVPRPTGMQWSGFVVGPTQLFNLEYQYDGHIKVTAIDRSTTEARAYDLVTGLTGSAPRLLSRGDGLAAFHPRDQHGGTLWEVDLETGSLGAALEHHVSDAHPMGPGGIAMTVDAQAPGTIAIDSGTGPVRLADFAPVSEGAARIAYDGDLRATWEDGTTWSIDPEDASADWTKTPWTTLEKVTTSGETTLVNDLENNKPTSHWHLSWPGGQRDIEGSDLVLGHGGQLLVRRASGDPATVQVERVRTGEVVATATMSITNLVADGSRVWSMSSSDVLTGVDVDQPDAPPINVPVTTNGARAAVLDVRGRWALVSVHGLGRVVDTRGVVPQWTPPAGANAPGKTMLGDGFVVSSTWTYDAYNHVSGYRTIVSELAPAHESRDLVDPLSGEVPTTYTVDEAGSRSLAYTYGGLPKMVKLPWLDDAPWTLPDTAAPTLGTTDAPAALTRSTTALEAHFAWTYRDEGTSASPASGISSADVRYRTRKAQGAFGAWTTVPSAEEAALTRWVQPGYEVCAQSSATDAAGNTTAWSQDRCVRVDGSAPVLAPATGSGRFTAPDDAGTVRYAYRATDDHAVGSYDVQARSARIGSGLGPWSALLSDTTATSLRQTVKAGDEWCFRFRARDIAGNLSAWSPARCSSIAIEDDTFYSPGDSLRKQSRLALDGFYTQLNHPGAWLKVRGVQVGHTLALWIMSGPEQGKAEVHVGGVRVKTLSLSATIWHRRLVTLRMPSSGTVKVVQDGSRPVGIDAIAVER